MRLPILLLCLALVGCASPKPKGPAYSPPSAAAVGKAVESTAGSIAKARAKAAELKTAVSPAGLATWEELTAELEAANTRIGLAGEELVAYAAKVDVQAVQLTAETEAKNAALASANYWQEKQAKALREIWIWRSAAFVLIVSIAGIVLAKLGFKFFF